MPEREEVYRVMLNNTIRRVILNPKENNEFKVKIDNKSFKVKIEKRTEDCFIAHVGDYKLRISLSANGNPEIIYVNQIPYKVKIKPELMNSDTRSLKDRILGLAGKTQISMDRKSIVSPLTGKLVEIKVKVGDEIKKGDIIAVIEAMKVRNEIEAPKNGRISSILVKENTIVKKGEVIAKIE